MKFTRIFLKLLSIILVGLTYQTTSAQTDYEKRQKASKENEQQLNRVYQNNLPNSRGSSVKNGNISEDIRIARAAAQQKENEIAAKQAAYEQTKKDLAEYAEEDKIRHKQRVKAIVKEQQPFMNYLSAELLNINIFDKADWYTDHLFIMVEGPKVRKMRSAEVEKLNYAAASTALTTFDAVKKEAPYQELVSLLDEGKLLFHSTRTRIAFLYERFPEQTKATELFELNFLPFYFGANRSYMMPAEEIDNYIDAPMYYPSTYFETGSRTENSEIAERFVALTNKYPTEGVAAAKNARRHLNPFVIFLQLLNTDNQTPEKTIALKNENYWRAIHSKNTDKNLKEAFNWLNCQKEMYAKLKDLSPEGWLDMGSSVFTLQHLDATFMIKGLLGGEPAPYTDLLSKKYKNLKKAVAIKDKALDTERKEKEKLERQKEKDHKKK